MRVAFAGSPPFATPIVENLLASRHALVGIVTPPDRPKGRGQKVEVSPLAALAESRGVPLLRTEDANTEAALETLRAWRPDVLLVASFGQLLKQPLLDLAPHGALNIHASLLPRWRGASPVARAIAAGDGQTGVAIQRMVRKLDAGPVCSSVTTPIAAGETAGELLDRLARLAGEHVPAVLDRLERGEAQFVPQNDAEATLAPKLRKEDGVVDFRRTAVEIERQVRAMTPWPGATCHLRLAPEASATKPQTDLPSLGVKLFRVEAKEAEPVVAPPGSILALPNRRAVPPVDAILVATGGGALRILQLQPEGGRVMTADEFTRGRPLPPGSCLIS